MNSAPSLGHRNAKTPRFKKAQGTKELKERKEREEKDEKGRELAEGRKEA